MHSTANSGPQGGNRAALSAVLAVACIASVGLPSATADEGVTLGPKDIRTAFFLEKSENKNQVHYGIRMDKKCQPVGKEPVFGYWRDWIDGKWKVMPFVSMDYRAYGIDKQSVDKDHRIHVLLKALPDKPITIEVESRGGRCVAKAHMTIDGERAIFRRAFVELRFMGVRHVDLFGTKADGKGAVHERVKP
ncbi:MAG: DUF4833 domain-containing protein [Myxococcales bacterium]|nr:DUF4833 domain-containing protein [Myxococcales bacterium]